MMRKPSLRGEELERRSLLTLTPLGAPILVNSEIIGDQAPNDAEFSATGDLLVTFSGLGASGSGVYARKFSAAGVPNGLDYFVHAGTNSRVAWGPNGESFITWEGTGPNGVGVYGRTYDATGDSQSDVFFIGAGWNEQAGTSDSEHFLSVTRDATGLQMRTYTLDGLVGSIQRTIGPASSLRYTVSEFGQVAVTRTYSECDDRFVFCHDDVTLQSYLQDTTTSGEVRIGGGHRANGDGTAFEGLPVEIDPFGNVVVLETNFIVDHDDSLPSQTVAARYDTTGIRLESIGFLPTFTTGLSQLHASKDGATLFQSMPDANGDVRWEALDALNRKTAEPSLHEHVQRFVAHPAVEATAGFFIAPDGGGSGAYVQRYTSTPRALRTFAPGVQYELSIEHPLIADEVGTLGVAFSVEMSQQGPASATDTANWTVLRDGTDISHTLTSIVYEYNSSAHAIGAELQFAHPLAPGEYTVIASDLVEDAKGVRLDGDADGVPGGDYSCSFKYSRYQEGRIGPAIISLDVPVYGAALAVDHAGNSVAAWSNASGTVEGRLMNKGGEPKGATLEISGFNQQAARSPDVAMDADGDFAVTWSHYYESPYVGLENTFFERYQRSGTPGGSGDRISGGIGFRGRPVQSISMSDDGTAVVLTTEESESPTPRYAVAMDADGDYAAMYSDYSGPETGFIEHLFVRAPSGRVVRVGNGIGRATKFDIAVDDVGNFIAVWEEGGLRGQRFDFDGNLVGPELDVGGGPSNIPRVAMDAVGNFVVAWTGAQDGQDAFARFYSKDGRPLGTVIPVAEEATGDQFVADVAMSKSGDAYVMWYGDSPRGTRTFLTALPVAPVVRMTTEQTWAVTIEEGVRLVHEVTELNVAFSEPVSAHDGDAASVTNTANWRLLRNGADVSSLIVAVHLTSDWNEPSSVRLELSTVLPEGSYELIAEDRIVGVDGNALDGDADGFPGGDFHRTFVIAYPRASGLEFPINQTSAGDQRTSPASQMNTAMRGDGAFVTTWASANQDGSGWGVYARLFNANSEPLTNEFRVNQFTAGDQRFSTVAMETNGDFVVTWTSDGQDGDSYGVYARRFNFDGTPRGNEFRVSETTAGLQGRSTIAMDDDGDFIVAWESKDQDGFGYGVYARRYTAGGQATGGEFLVNQTVLSDQRLAGVAMAPYGDFIVTWTTFNQDGSGDGVYARRYDANSVALGDEFRVNTATASTQRFSRIAMDRTGDFVVAWMSNLQDGDGYGIYAQRYNKDNAPEGAEFRVNQTTAGHQQYPAIDLDDDGDFVIAWASANQDGSDFGIYARRYSPGGVAQGDEFRVNTTTAGQQTLPSVAMDADGDFTIVWNSVNQDGDGFGVFAQRYSANSGPRADAGGPYTVQEGGALTLNAGGSTDPDQADLLTFGWDLNGDGDFSDVVGATPGVGWGTLAALGINDDSANLYNIRVRVTDSAGNFDEAAATIEVTNTAPTIALAGAAAINEGATYSLTLGAITDPGADTVTSWTVRWGDGSSNTYTSGGVKTHVYANGPATNTIRVDLTDEDGVYLSAGTRTVTVNNVAPLLSGLTAATIDEDGVAHLRGTITDPGALDGLTLHVYWGDNVMPELIPLPGGTTTFDVTHRYLDDPAGPPPDEFPIDVILRDADGAQDTDSLRITVRNAAPQATITGLQTENPVGELVSLTSQVYDPGTLDTFTYAWRVERDGVLFASGVDPQFSFTPDAEGIYAVQLTVRDDDDGVDVVTASIRVPGDNMLTGDTNADGVVDLVDLNNVRNNFGGAGLGDTDGDGDVDLEDLNAVRNNFGASLPAPGSSVSHSTQRRGVVDERVLDRGAADAVFGQLALATQERDEAVSLGNARRIRGNPHRFMATP